MRLVGERGGGGERRESKGRKKVSEGGCGDRGGRARARAKAGEREKRDAWHHVVY